MSEKIQSLSLGDTARVARSHQGAARIARAKRSKAARESAKDSARLERELWGGAGHSFLARLTSRVPTGRATTRNLRVLYPFLADSGLGAAGILIGHDAYSRSAFCFDPFTLYERRVLTNPNIALAGVIGSGKSSLMKTLALRGLAMGRRTYVPGDVKGEWSALARAVGGHTIALDATGTNRLNPLDAGARAAGLSAQSWRESVSKQRLTLLASLAQTMLERPLAPLEHTALSTALTNTQATTTTPLIGGIVRGLLDPPEGAELPLGVSARSELALMGREVGHCLMRLISGDLAGTFDGPSTVSFDARAPMITIDLAAFGVSHPALPLIMTCTSSWMEGALRDPNAGKRFIIYDEAHRLLELPALLSRMKDQYKLSRAWGISNILVLHRLSDLAAVGKADSKERALAAGLLADTSTRIIYRQESDQLAATTSALGLSNVSAQIVSSLACGQGLWMVGKRLFVVNHSRSNLEIDLTDTDKAMVEARKL